jgi:hypothetical protein
VLLSFVQGERLVADNETTALGRSDNQLLPRRRDRVAPEAIARRRAAWLRYRTRTKRYIRCAWWFSKKHTIT